MSLEYLEHQVLHNCGSHVNIGIIGRGNCGKSLLFNTLTSNKIALEDNELYSSIQPCARTEEYICDKTKLLLEKLEPLSVSLTTHALYEFPNLEAFRINTDIVNLLRRMDVFIYCIRSFQSEIVTEDCSDSYDDYDSLEQIMLLQDLLIIENEISQLVLSIDRNGFSGQYDSFRAKVLLTAWKTIVGSPRSESSALLPTKCLGKQLRFESWETAEVDVLLEINLLTMKNSIVVVNMNERDYLRLSSEKMSELCNVFARKGINKSLVLASSFEFERRMYELRLQGEFQNYFKANPSHISKIGSILPMCFLSLKIIHFFTFDNLTKSLSVWRISDGTTVEDAASKIDETLYRSFLKAVVISFHDFVDYSGNIEAIRTDKKAVEQGKRYVVNDGDIIEFKSKRIIR